jgi:hypothetical protein
MKPRATLLLAVMPIGYLLALLGWSYSVGFPKQGNDWAFAMLGILVGYLILTFFVLVFLIASARAKRRRNEMFPGLLALFLLLAGFFLKPLVKESYWLGVRHDLKGYDVAAIRLEVEAILKSPESGDSDNSDGYFGQIVPLDQVPNHLRKLAGGSRCVRTQDGIVLLTDGLGNWRGGYLFTPPYKETSRPNAQAVMPGVYYLISQ